MHTLPTSPTYSFEASEAPMTPAAIAVIRWRFVLYAVLLLLAIALIVSENRAYRDTDTQAATGSRPAAAAPPAPAARPSR